MAGDLVGVLRFNSAVSAFVGGTLLSIGWWADRVGLALPLPSAALGLLAASAPGLLLMGDVGLSDLWY